MEKKSKLRTVLTIIVIAVLVILRVIFVFQERNEKKEIAKYETDIEETIKMAINTLDNYKRTGDYKFIVQLTTEFEDLENYLQQIAFKSDKLGIGWDISTVIGRLKSFRAGEEIKGLDDLEKGLECMEEDIYSVGGYDYLRLYRLGP